LLAGLFCAGVAAAAVIWLQDVGPKNARHTGEHQHLSATGDAARLGEKVPRTADVQRRLPVYDVVLDRFEDGGYETTVRFMAPLKDVGSIYELREAIRGRGRRAIAALRANYDQLAHGASTTPEQTRKTTALEQSIGFVHMYDGKFLNGRARLRLLDDS
jgi:hypothetical protein